MGSALADPEGTWDRMTVEGSSATAILEQSQTGIWDEMSHLCSAQGDKHLQFSLNPFSISKYSTCQQHCMSPFTNLRQLKTTKNTFCLFFTKGNNHNYENPCSSRGHLHVTGMKSPVCQGGLMHEEQLK